MGPNGYLVKWLSTFMRAGEKTVTFKCQYLALVSSTFILKQSLLDSIAAKIGAESKVIFLEPNVCFCYLPFFCLPNEWD